MESPNSSNNRRDATQELFKNVVTPFRPTIAVMVSYGDVKVINGCELMAIAAANAPTVEIGGEADELYTLIMIDPDAPNPNDPQLQQDVSWIVTNIPGGNSSAEGTEVMSYEGPHPEVGVHRYILVLFRQQEQLAIEALASRVHFNTCVFADMHNLGNPVGMAYFNVQRQPNKAKNKA